MNKKTRSGSCKLFLVYTTIIVPFFLFRRSKDSGSLGFRNDLQQLPYEPNATVRVRLTCNQLGSLIMAQQSRVPPKST